MRLRGIPDASRTTSSATPGRWITSVRRARSVAVAFGLILLLGPGAGEAAPSSSASRIRYLISSGVRYLYLADIAAHFGMRYEPAGRRFVLSSRYSLLTFTQDSTEAIVNGTRVHLSDAPWTAHGQALVADVDFRLLLSPILTAKDLRRGNVRRVLIDPGHGGKDPGTLGRRHPEKEITLQVARRLEKELTARGYQVALTRTRDQNLALEARTQHARTWKADVFVSLHCNAAPATVRGIEIFRASPEGARSTYGTRRATGASINSPWDADNARLAYDIQKNVIAATGAGDRGVRNARFAVLRDCPCPAVLVEMGFLSNTADEANLASAAYQTNLARGIAEGISRYDACLPPR